MLKLLRRIPGAEVIDLDAGCCGMAGSFGYEVGALRDLAAGRRTAPLAGGAPMPGRTTVIVAPGFSCRLQIQHFTGREAVHPAVLLRSCLS